MHLKSLSLERFRSFEICDIFFDPYLTALVGENNGGKSSVIDAIRLLTLPINGRRELYCEEGDVRRGSAERSFRLAASYEGLSPTQKGLLISAMPTPTDDLALFGVDFGPGLKRPKPHFWAGAFGGDAEPGASDLIRHVYLPPLRDAQRSLASGNPSRIAALLRHFLNEDGEEAFKSDLKRNPKTQALTDINASVTTVLKDLTGGVREQTAALGLADGEELYDIARDLRFKLADSGISPEDLKNSGLGYANLLFMTTVMVELEKAKDADLTLFLVEEPEAHLHPQLQMLVLDFLREKAIASAQKTVSAGMPAGRVQVIVTSHSPNLTAWVRPENLVVMKSVRVPPDARAKAKAIAISRLELSKRTLDKINRYVDTTRSALLFGGRVLLLEGIAEALLIPAFAERLFTSRGQDGQDRDRWKRLQGATLIAIDGVDFIPYLDLLLKSVEGSRIGERVVVVTDSDPTVAGDRPKLLRDRAAAWGASEEFDCFTNLVTLEQSLYSATNAAVLKAAFMDIRRNSLERWETEIEQKPLADQPSAFLALFGGTNPVRKGDFAQALAYRLEHGNDKLVPPYFTQLAEAARQPAISAFESSYAQFEIPAYLKDAIMAITK